MLAMILSVLSLAATHPQTLWVCNPGHSPLNPAPSNCERLHYTILYRFPMP